MNKKVDLGKISITLHNLEWNSTTVFEELTITPYEGESYISLTATQGNNPKTSPNFWMKVSARGESIYDLMVRTGKFDGTLEEFIQEYDDAVKNAETATSEVRALESEVRTSENTRIQNESTRVLNELTRISHENTRENNELTRKNNEITRLDKEEARERREQIRIDNENTRVSNESIRENHETLRKLNETTRLSAEQDRITNENTRIEREVTRVRNENTRNSQEGVRLSNETDRQSAEDLRKENETTRQENESDRNAERLAWNGVLNQKILDINTLISDVNSSEQTRLSNETTRQENEEERIQLMSTWGTEWTLKVLDIEDYLETAYTKDQVDDLLDTKQDNLTFDTTPTKGSVNPIQSGGVQVALMDRAIVGDIVGDPVKAWEPGTTEAYIDQKIAELNAVLNAKISRQDAMIKTIIGQDIVLVSVLPQTGEANKIYRLTGTDSYTDYMWDTSLATPAFTAIATYGFPGIDEEPTAESDNLVKSKGVYNLTAGFQKTLEDISEDNITHVNQMMEDYQPIVVEGNVENAPDEEDLTSVNVGGTDVIRFKDKTYNADLYSGLGKVYLRKNVVNGVNTLTQSMINQANTIYVIQYDFTLGEDITIPTDCVLKFDGGSISGEHTLTGTNTGIQAGLVKIFNTDIIIAGSWNVALYYPEWFGAKGDGITDDTTALQKMNGKTFILQEKTYRATNLVYNSYTSILGKNKASSCIKQLENSTGDLIDLVDWYGGRVENIMVEGVSDTEYEVNAYYPALLRIYNLTSNHVDPSAPASFDQKDILTNYSTINNVVICNAPKCGLTVLGKDEVHVYTHNWIHHISNIWINSCGDYGIVDTATDNLWNNVNVSHCGKANMLLISGSEVFSNVKLDGESGYKLSGSSALVLGYTMSGALLVLYGGGNIFTGLDLLSCLYSGVKIYGKNNKISGTCNNCGVNYPNSLSNQYNCPAIYFGATAVFNQIDMLIYQLSATYGAGTLGWESPIPSNNQINLVFRPADGTSGSAYKHFINRVNTFKVFNDSINNNTGNIGIVYKNANGAIALCSEDEWVIKDKTNIIPQGLLIPCSTGDFILCLKNINTDLKLQVDSNSKVEGPNYATYPFEDSNGYETTRRNYVQNSDNNAFKVATEYTFDDNTPSSDLFKGKWYIWTLQQAVTVMINLKKINRLLVKLGGEALWNSNDIARYWTSTIANSIRTSCYSVNMETGEIYVESITTKRKLRLVANYRSSKGLYNYGPTTLRNGINNGYLRVGYQYFDETLGKPVYWNGTAWVDALGNAVDTVYPKVTGTPTNGNLAKFNGNNIEDAGVAPQV